MLPVANHSHRNVSNQHNTLQFFLLVHAVESGPQGIRHAPAVYEQDTLAAVVGYRGHVSVYFCMGVVIGCRVHDHGNSSEGFG